MSAPVPVVVDPLAVKPQASQDQIKLEQIKDEAKGATVYSFDPNASPEEKAAQAESAAKAKIGALPNLPDIRGPEVAQFKQDGGASLASDVDDKGNIKLDKKPPTTGSQDAKKLTEQTRKDEQKDKAQGVGPTPPGSLPTGEVGSKVRELPDWFQIGWSGQKRIFYPTPEEDLQRSLLSDFAEQTYYGKFYHNAGIIVFAIVATHFVTLFGGGWGWLILIGSICATYYKTSIERTRRYVRDDMVREVAKKGLQSEVETAMWLNNFMNRFWIIYEPILSKTIIATVDQILSVSCPSFLHSIEMSNFTLGTKPPRIDHVRTFPDTEDDVVLMDYAISFIPNDILDLTTRQAQKKINPKITVSIKMGIAPAILTKDIHVEDISFQGVMRIRLKLMNLMPHVKIVDISFLQPPVIDFVPRPIGFDMSIIPGFKSSIMSIIHGSLGPMMYQPNTYTLNLEQMLSGAPVDTACGVLAITLYSGKGLKATKLGGGAPDPYVSVSVAGRAELARTKKKLSTANPVWNETKFILLNNLNEMLTLVVKDWNEHRPDSDLGTANFDLKSLETDGQQEGVQTEVLHDGKPRGQIRFDAVYCPVLQAKKRPDGTEEPIPESKCGIVRLTVHQCKDIDTGGQQIKPFFFVTLNGDKIAQSKTLKHTQTPVWEESKEFLVQERSLAQVGVQIMDDNSMSADRPLGNIRVKLDELLAATKNGDDQFPLSSAKSGQIKLTATWKPVLMAGSINGAGAYTPPIGVVRVLFKRGIDLRNVELTGASDPYGRILANGIVVARTLIMNNNLNPEWDEIVYIQVHNPKDSYVLEVMDYQHMGKDRTLGSAKLNVAELIEEGEDKRLKPWIGTGKKSQRLSLSIDRKGPKGTVELELEFFPCAHLKNMSFKEPVSDSIAEGDEEEEEEETTPATAPAAAVAAASGKEGEKPAVNGDVEAPKKKEKDPNEGIVIPREELLKTQSGILVFQIVSGSLARKGARLEVLFDDGYWPAYSTEPARSPHAVWDEIGECFIRELDVSQIIFKLNLAEKETREDIIATKTVDMNQFLEMALDKPAVFNLGGGNSVTIACKYVPVDIVLEPRESVNNSGRLRVELLDAENLPGGDNGGKSSDPYVTFKLNGEKIATSKTIKKTLNPTWNEVFTDISIMSRVAAKFEAWVYDWDIGPGTDDKLAMGPIDLAALEPMEQMAVTIPLQHIGGKPNKNGPPSLRLKLTFQPAFVVRTRQATSTFGAAGRVGTTLAGGVGNIAGGVGHIAGGVGHIAGSGVGAVGSGIIGVGGAGVKGVGAVGKGMFGGLKKVGTIGGGHSRKESLGSTADIPPVPPVPAQNAAEVIPPAAVAAVAAVPAVEGYAVNGANGHSRELSGATTATANGGIPGTPGLLSITVLSVTGAGDPEEKKAVLIKSNGREVGTSHSHKGDPAQIDESFTTKTSASACQLEFSVIHKKTIGKDHVLGTGAINLWDHMSAASSPTTDVQVPLADGSGTINVKLSWTPTISAPNSPSADNRSVAGSTRRSVFGSRNSVYGK
ncbi:tricalbin [Meredithblackwellia eburnea MCA 4105]